jgi:hypothetical protein
MLTTSHRSLAKITRGLRPKDKSSSAPDPTPDKDVRHENVGPEGPLSELSEDQPLCTRTCRYGNTTGFIHCYPKYLTYHSGKKSNDYLEITLRWEAVTMLKKNKNVIVIGCEKFKCKFHVDNHKLLYKLCKHSYDHNKSNKLDDCSESFSFDSASPRFTIPPNGKPYPQLFNLSTNKLKVFVGETVKSLMNDPILEIFNHPPATVDIPERATVVNTDLQQS